MTQDADWFRARLPEPDRLDEILGGDPAVTLLQVAKDRAPVETGFRGDVTPEQQAAFDLAVAAAEKLKQQRRPALTPEEIGALHAFVHLVARPALRVREGDLPQVPESWRKLEQRRPVVGHLIQGVGRIDDHERRPEGTGWFVAEDLLITNNHVVAGLCGIRVHTDPQWRSKLDDRLPAYNERWADEPEARPVWDPGDSPHGEQAAGRIRHVPFTHPEVDLALCRIEGVDPGDQTIIPLSATAPQDADDEVYVAGYPAVQAAARGLHPALVTLLFDEADPVVHKRVSPGKVTAVAKPKADHDASTLGGSSGSAVIDFKKHRAVALHYSGIYGERNLAVALWTIKDQEFFAEYGIQFVGDD